MRNSSYSSSRRCCSVLPHRYFLAALLVCAAVPPVQAGSITVIDSIIANGSLDGNAFSNALVTLTLTGNTSSITSGSYYYDLIGPATVTVAGTGSDSLSGTVDVAVCDLSACNPASAGFNQQIGSGPDYNIFGTINNAAFVTYGLNSSFGPVSGASYGNNRTWPTDDGSLSDFVREWVRIHPRLRRYFFSRAHCQP